MAAMVLALAPVTAAAAGSERGAPIVLGMSGALTGASARLGMELRDGMEACFDRINREGGIQGRPIVLKVYDDGYNPDPAIHNTPSR
jgi:branched-chain amino acid transport system substrate-binding protein